MPESIHDEKKTPTNAVREPSFCAAAELRRYGFRMKPACLPWGSLLTLLLLIAPAAGADSTAEFVIDYSDLERYDQTMDSIDSGTDAELAFREYYRGGGNGMSLWLERVDAPAERVATFMARRVEAYPAWARMPYGYAKTLRDLEPLLRAFYGRLQSLFPDGKGPILPTYFLVGVLNGSGSWALTGNFVTLGAFNAKPGKSFLDIEPGVDITDVIDLKIDPAIVLQTAVHELVHHYQQIYQGLPGYLAMYRDRQLDTNIARAVREGVAEFIADLAIAGDASRLANVHARTRYFYENEAAIWRLFEPVASELNSDDNGWFYGVHPTRPEMPFQIGYSLGREMAKTYYEAAEDKPAAIRFLLSANDAESHRAILDIYRASRLR